MVGGRENGTHPSSVHPSPPKTNLCWRGTPPTWQWEENWKRESRAHRPIVREKTNGAFQLRILIYNAIVTVPLTIRSR